MTTKVDDLGSFLEGTLVSPNGASEHCFLDGGNPELDYIVLVNHNGANERAVIIAREGAEQKYIHGFADGKEFVVSLPLGYHTHIKKMVESACKIFFDKETFGGGWIKWENDSLILYGESSDWKTSDHNAVSKVIKRHYPNVIVRI